LGKADGGPSATSATSRLGGRSSGSAAADGDVEGCVHRFAQGEQCRRHEPGQLSLAILQLCLAFLQRRIDRQAQEMTRHRDLSGSALPDPVVHELR
jgi:hypothetical protein